MHRGNLLLFWSAWKNYCENSSFAVTKGGEVLYNRRFIRHVASFLVTNVDTYPLRRLSDFLGYDINRAFTIRCLHDKSSNAVMYVPQ